MTNHKVVAEEILEHKGSLSDPNGLALAHATLYLAEQQRIANLLALAQFDHDAEGRRLFTNLEYATKLRSEAAIALGVTP